MSLFKGSTPERRGADDKVLPIIPNEIYLHIFDFIAPSTPDSPVFLDERNTLRNLSGVCRFFANICLPRIFCSVEFSTSKGSYEAFMLCGQSASKQPLALPLARLVRSCRFTDWCSDDPSFAENLIDTLVHMHNLRELRFWYCLVDTVCWSAIAALPTLEFLSFEHCTFENEPEESEENVKVEVKVSQLRVHQCFDYDQAKASADVTHVRVLEWDLSYGYLGHMDWLLRQGRSESTITELRLSATTSRCYRLGEYEMHTLPLHAPQSLEVLYFALGVSFSRRIARDIFRCMLDDPAWRKNFCFLRSLTLKTVIPDLDEVRFIRRRTIEGWSDDLAEIRHIICDELGPAFTNLTHIDCFGTVFYSNGQTWTD